MLHEKQADKIPATFPGVLHRSLASLITMTRNDTSTYITY